MNNLAIIPARSGSKGLRNKNIMDLCGKPMMAYSIEAAIKSKQFETVHVSTDLDEYAIIATKFGAEVPFLRSEKFATDDASSWSVVKEVFLQYQKIGKNFDTICLLQPTSPLRQSDDIQSAYELYKSKNAKVVVSVSECEHSPLWCNILPNDLSMSNFINTDLETKTRQENTKFYRLNGAIYIVDTHYLMDDERIYGKETFAYIMSKKRSIDIDDKYDFNIANLLLHNE